MLDLSFIDPKLFFPDLTEVQLLVLENFSNILSTISTILLVIAEWNIFKKIGEKPWKSLILFYNVYVLYKYVWGKKFFWAYLISSAGFGVAHIATQYSSIEWTTLFVLISLPFFIVTSVCSILYTIRFAEAFGKGIAFSVGLFLMYSVFALIIAFGKSQYIGGCDEEQTGSSEKASNLEGEVI